MPALKSSALAINIGIIHLAAANQAQALRQHLGRQTIGGEQIVLHGLINIRHEKHNNVEIIVCRLYGIHLQGCVLIGNGYEYHQAAMPSENNFVDFQNVTF